MYRTSRDLRFFIPTALLIAAVWFINLIRTVSHIGYSAAPIIRHHFTSHHEHFPPLITPLICPSRHPPYPSPLVYDISLPTGEPINPEAWRWYNENVGASKCSIVDTYWQTETGAHIAVNLPGNINSGCDK